MVFIKGVHGTVKEIWEIGSAVRVRERDTKRRAGSARGREARRRTRETRMQEDGLVLAEKITSHLMFLTSKVK
ncbi:hypothetical protein NDU88_008331 [Pleurodeles waltl]|uniref:Uncharacterized protein n=1 Tax=Pleurodeles waltl TaxID=8319 RepID=A0AAV7PRB5_PLEWA|nr:hypothetical protein NDU88_008331 [Pleurodeles waltl]